MAVSDLLRGAGLMDEGGEPETIGSAPFGLSENRREQASQEKRGPLLDEPSESKVFKAIDREVKRQEKAAKNRYERHKRNKWWRQGKRYVRLIEKVEDKGILKAWSPPGSSYAPDMPNKVDDLCRKLVAQMTVDPPAPEVEPATDSESDTAAAEFATRFLKADGQESGTNDAAAIRAALEVEMTHASGFQYLYVDPHGNGWKPKEIMAHPEAPDASNPLIGPLGDRAVEPILRYVNGPQFVESATDAEKQWLPKICTHQLNPEHVRFLPETAKGIADAEGVILLEPPVTLAALRARYEPEDEPWSDAQIQEMLAWRPPRWRCLVPKAVVAAIESDDARAKDAKDDEKAIRDDALVFTYCLYRRSTPLYPEGCDIVVNGGGDGYVLHKEAWSAEVAQPDGGEKTECLDLPVAQFRGLDDPMDGDPFGLAPVEKFGPGDELRANVIGAWVEHMDRFLHPNVYIPVTSPVQARHLELRDGTPIVITAPEDKPDYEDVPDFPSFAEKFLEFVTEEMNNASGLQETAQGLESNDSQSGVAKRAVIEQSLVALGQMFQNMTDGARRFWRLKLQLARAKMTVPQLVGFVGEDGAYKQEWWTGADFAGAKDVAIARGSGTMMSPSAKQEYISGLQLMGALSPDEAQEMIRTGVTGIVGLMDDPRRTRVKKQIKAWSDGPPEDWTPASPQMDPMTGQPVVDPMTGQPVVQPPSSSPFDPRLCDEEPDDILGEMRVEGAARIRYRELSKLMASTDYGKHPPEWRALVDQEYQRMRQAAGVQTIAEQQAVMAQQQAMEQEAAAQQQAGDAEDKAADREAKGAEAQAARESDAQQNAAQREFEMQREKVRGQNQMQSEAVRAQMRPPAAQQ